MLRVPPVIVSAGYYLILIVYFFKFSESFMSKALGGGGFLRKKFRLKMEWAIAFSLSIVWYIAGMVQGIGHAVWVREYSLFDKLIMFPINLSFLISQKLKTVAGLQKSSYMEGLAVISSIVISAVVLLLIYRILKVLKNTFKKQSPPLVSP